MGYSKRIIFFNPDGTCRKISIARFKKLWDYTTEASFPEYAGIKIKCAIVYVEVRRHRVLRIVKTDYILLHFDNKGGLDKEEIITALKSKLYLLKSEQIRQKSKITEITSLINRKESTCSYKWIPDKWEESSIGEIALA